MRSLHLDITIALGLSALMQAIRFIVLGRGLGTEDFGRLMVLQALAEFAQSFVSVGAAEIVLRVVSIDRSRHSDAFGHALVMTLATALPTAMALAVATVWWSGVATMALLLLFFLSELIWSRISGIADYTFMAHARPAGSNVVRLSLSAGRLTAALVAFHVGQPTLLEWLQVQAYSNLVISLAAAAFISFVLGPPRPCILWKELAYGRLVAGTLLLSSIQGTFDRIALGAVATPAFVGVYAAGRRVLELAELPVIAVQRMLLPRLWSTSAAEGRRGANRVAVVSILPLMMASWSGAAAIWLSADVLAGLLGPDFRESAPIMRGMAFVPIFKSMQLLQADLLTVSGKQSWRTAMEAVGVAVYLAALPALAMAFGMAGVVSALYAYQALLALFLFAALRRLSRTSAGTPDEPQPAIVN